VQVNKSWAATLTSMTFLAACAQGPSSGSAPVSSTGTAAPALASLPAGSGPVTIHCGDGKQALVKQVLLNGQTVSQVECLDARVVSSRELPLLEDQPQPIAVAPPAPRAAVRTLPRIVVRDDEEPPTVVRTSTRTAEPEPVRPAARPAKRKGVESAAIIVGSTGAGAGVGAIVGGKKGALIGAVIGGLGGTIFDRTTREKK
jgi:hypothetical protein